MVEVDSGHQMMSIGNQQDMDLIDILWRQDMDLGVGREMFDQNRRKELEKERELELLKKEKEQELKAQEVKEQSEPPQEQQQINYIVDGETGELVPAPPGSSEVTTQQPVLVVDLPPTLEENESVSIEEAMRILEEETGPLCNNSLSISSNNNNDTNLPNINLNVGQLEQEIQAMIQNAEAFNHTQPQVAYERQDSFERSWQDVANMLNLPTDNGTMTPGLNMSTSPAMPNVSQALLNNATLAPQTQNNNNNMNFTENTDAGFAPVQNNSLPYTNTSLPSTDATQGLFCLDTNDLLFPNVTCTGEQNDSFSQTQTLLQQLMSEDDLEPMDFTNVTVSQGLQSVRLMDDASSDSAVSSMGSSASPVQEMSDTHSNFSEVSSPFDGLEGATGGSNLSDGSGSKYPQRKDKFSFARYGSYGGSDMNTNSSGSSNDSSGSFHPADMRHVNHNHSYPLQPGQQSREAKRRAEEERKERLAHSRDEKRAKSLKIPFSTDDIIDSPVERFNEMMQKYKLTEPQLQLIRDIRRRGKNKVAAQNCRKRKLEVIGTLEDEVIAMRAEKERLRKERLMIDKEAAEVKERLNQLYQEVFHSLRDDSGHPYDPSEYTLQHTSDGNVFLVPRNETSSQPHKEKGQKKRKGSKKNH